MRRTVMVLAAVLALMLGGASVAVGAEHNERPEHNQNPPCENPGAAGEMNPHCPEGPPGHQRGEPEEDDDAATDEPETDTVEAEHDGDAAAEDEGDAAEGDAVAEEEGGDAAAEDQDGDDAAPEDDAAAGADAIEDGGIATDFLLMMDDFFGDLFIVTDEADQIEVG